MTQYICKPIEVSAWQITEIRPQQKNQSTITVVLDDNTLYDIDPSKMSRMIPMVGDYLVRTCSPDVYEYLNPKHVFEAKYTRLSADTESKECNGENLSFGEAIYGLKKGKKLARAGWNGKGMYLYHVPANSYQAQTDAARAEFGDLVPYGAYIAMKTAQNNVVPWLASQTDVLAEDWEIVA